MVRFRVRRAAIVLSAALAVCGAGPAKPEGRVVAKPEGRFAAEPAGRVVALTTRPGSRLERDAAKLVAEDLASARHANERPVMLVGSAHLSAGGGPAALFVQVQSASLCGSAGCSTSLFVKHGQRWARVMDSVSGPIKIAPSVHQGMHDLLVHGTDRWVWNGSAYADTLPAPTIDLK